MHSIGSDITKIKMGNIGSQLKRKNKRMNSHIKPEKIIQGGHSPKEVKSPIGVHKKTGAWMQPHT
jgi:hypothetical protein